MLSFLVDMLSSQNALDHAHHHGWCMDALISEWSRPPPDGCSSVRMHQTINIVIMVGPRMLMFCAQNALDHGRDHATHLYALLSDCSRPWTLSCLGHGCFLVRLHPAMDVIMVGMCMLCAQNALDHGQYHGWSLDALLLSCP